MNTPQTKDQELPEIVKCPDCQGKGYLGVHEQDTFSCQSCPTCHGWGNVEKVIVQ